MSQTEPCFSAARISVQRQLQGNQYRGAKPLMNDSKRLIVLPKTAFFFFFFQSCSAEGRRLTRIDKVPRRSGFQNAANQGGEKQGLGAV